MMAGKLVEFDEVCIAIIRWNKLGKEYWIMPCGAKKAPAKATAKKTPTKKK
jgi:hypothetical protein